MKKEICKFANSRTSFIVEALLANRSNDGRVFDKLVFIIIERSEENKTIKKVSSLLLNEAKKTKPSRRLNIFSTFRWQKFLQKRFNCGFACDGSSP